MASAEIREDIVQLVVAAYDAGPDIALMRELEAIVDAQGGGLSEVAAALTGSLRWSGLYPSSQSPAEFADAWLGTLLPGAGDDLLAVGRDIVVPFLEAGEDPAGLLLAAQDFLSDPGVPAEFSGLADAFLDRSGAAMAELAAAETREDIIQLVVAAHDAAPDPALMAELEAITDGGGTLLEVAEALTAGERWDELHPSSQTPEDFADAWLEALLPGAGAALLTAGREIVVPYLDGGGDRAGLVLLAQEFLSAIVVPSDFSALAEDFRERGEAAAAELAAADARQDIVQLAVAAYDAAPGAVLMAELEAIVDGGGTLLQVAEALVAGERWYALYPRTGGAEGILDAWLRDWALGTNGVIVPWSAEEFADAWLGNLLPGLGASALAARRDLVVGRLDAGDSFAAVLLEMQDLLSAEEVPAGYEGAARAFLNKGEVAQEHSVELGLDGDAAALRGALAAVTEDPATVRAAIDALGGMMPGGQMPAGSGSGGGQAPDVPARRDSMDDQGLLVLSEFDVDEDGTYDRAEVYAWNAAGDAKIRIEFYEDWDEAVGTDDLDMQRLARHYITTYTYHENGKTKTELTKLGYPFRHGVLRLFEDDDRKVSTKYKDSVLRLFDADGRKVSIKYDKHDDGTYDRIETYTYHDNSKTKKVSIKYDEDYDGTYNRIETYTYDDNGELKTEFHEYDTGWRGVGTPDDGTVDHRMLLSYDINGRLESKKFDSNADDTYDRFETYTYHENGKTKKMTIKYNEHYDTYDQIETYTYHENGELKTEFHEYDDGWGVGTPNDGTVDRRTFRSYDINGRLESERRDRYDGDDGTYDYERINTYTYHDNGELKTTEHYKNDFFAGGKRSSRKLRSYDIHGRLESEKVDRDDDGWYDQIETYTYHENGELKTEFLEYERGANDGTVDSRTFRSYDINGRLESEKVDDDGDGTNDRIKTYTYDENGELKTFLIEDNENNGQYGYYFHDSGTVYSRELRSYDINGRLESEKVDDDGDGWYERIETYTYHDNGNRKTHLYEYDDGINGGTADDGTVDSVKLRLFDADGRKVSSKYDDDNDGTYSRVFTYTYNDNGAQKTQLIEFDDGSGGGTPDDGIVDNRRLGMYGPVGKYGYAEIVSTEWDNVTERNDGVHDSLIIIYLVPLPIGFKIERGIEDSLRTIYTYDANGQLASTKFDRFGDGRYEGVVTYTRHENGGIKTRLIDHDGRSIHSGTYDTVNPRRGSWDLHSYDINGRLESVKYDDGRDGIYDQIDTYTYHDNGALKTQLFEIDNRGLDPYDPAFYYNDGTVEERHLHTYDINGGQESRKHGVDVDYGVYERIETYTYHDNGEITTREGSVDWSGSGSGCGTYGDGTFTVYVDWDWGPLYTYDVNGRPVSEKVDDDGDGTYERIETSTYHDNGEITYLSEVDSDDDGTVNNRVLGTYDIRERLEYEKRDIDADGTWDYIWHHSSGIQAPATGFPRYRLDRENRVVLIEFDEDGDGTFERAEQYAWNGAGAKIHTDFYDDWDQGQRADRGFRPPANRALRNSTDNQNRVVLTEFDEDGDGTWDRAEAYAWDADGTAKIRTDFYDGWDYTMFAAAQQADRALHVMQDYDSDGTDDDSKTEIFDDAGRVVKVVFDHDTDQSDDRVETYTYGSDTADRRWLSKAEDHDADGTIDLKTSATYQGTTDALATRLKDYDDGSGGGTADDGTVDRNTLETFDEDGKLLNTKYDDDVDGAWDHTKDPQVRDATDDQGLLALREFDDGGDDMYERAEAYAYGDGDSDGTNDADHRIRTDFYDDWDDSKVLADLPDLTLDIGRSAHFRQTYDDVGVKDDSKTETFDLAGRAVRVEFDYGSDGTVERVEQYAYDGAAANWKHYWANIDATADDVFERWLTATRDPDGRISELDAGGSSAGVQLGDVLAGNTGMLTVAGSAFNDSLANQEIAGGDKAAGTLGTGQTFNLGDGRDTFTVRDSAATEDAFDGAGDQTKSAPRLTVDGGEGGDMIIAPVDVLGFIAVAGGRGRDTFKFVDGVGSGVASGLAGHFICFNGGPGDDTLLLDAEIRGGDLAPRARIESVENIRLNLTGSLDDGKLLMRLFVASGFRERVGVSGFGTSHESLKTAEAEVSIRFTLDPGVDGGRVDLSNVAAAGRLDSLLSIDVEGGPGDDELTGGPGVTVFRFDADRGGAGGDDAVRGYNADEGDTIVISGDGVRDDSTTVARLQNDTVIKYTLVDGAGAETEHEITVEGVSAGVAVTSETAGGPAAIDYDYEAPPIPIPRNEGPAYDKDGLLVSEGFDADDDGYVERYETYDRDSDGFIATRTIEYDDDGDGFYDRRRLDTYSDGELRSVKYDLDIDDVWDIIDRYTYPVWSAKAYEIRRTVTSDILTPVVGSGTYRLQHYHAGDGGDGRVSGEGGNFSEWFRTGPGDDIVRGGRSPDLFVIDAGGGLDTILDFGALPQDREDWTPSRIWVRDRIWIREEGVAFGDLSFADDMRKPHPAADSKTSGVVVSWDGEDRLWLPRLAKADMNSDLFLFGDDVIVVPEFIGRNYIRDGTGRATEVRYYEGWDGSAGFDSLDPERVQKFVYEGSDEHWTTSYMNANPFDDGKFEIKVTIERYGNGMPISRTFEYDDGRAFGQIGRFANDDVVDRRRQDFFDENGRIVKILLTDNEDYPEVGQWRYADTYTYDEGDGLHPRGRTVQRLVDHSTPPDGTYDQTEDATHLVYGTDGNDRGHAALVGTEGADWFIPGPGDDIVDIDRRSKDDSDLFIIRPRHGTDLMGLYDGDPRTDVISIGNLPWADTASRILRDNHSPPLSWRRTLIDLDNDKRYEELAMEFPIEAFGGDSLFSIRFYGDQAHDRLLFHDTDKGWDHWVRGGRMNGLSSGDRPLGTDGHTGPATSYTYGSRNQAWTLDDDGRVTEIRYFDAWDGDGDPSYMNLAPDRVHRYTYIGDSPDWSTLSKNENALTDDVFEYLVTVERDAQGRITKEMIGFDDGQGTDANRQTANDGTVDRQQENTYDASATPPRISSSKYDHNNNRTWDVVDMFQWDGAVTQGPNTMTRTVGSAAADPAVTFIYGTDGDDTKAGTAAADWIDAGKGDDDITGAGGADVFIFRYGDGVDVIQDFEADSDTIWIRVDGFAPDQVEATVVTLGASGDSNHPYIPDALNPASGTKQVAVLDYGGGENDRIIIVGGTADAETYRAHFLAHAGDIPDFGG